MAISLASLKANPLKPERILIYGPEGIGKGTFALCEHAPETPDSPPGWVRKGVVLIQTEDGEGLMNREDGGVWRFDLAKSYQDVLDMMTALIVEDHEFDTLVVDSLDWLEPLIWDQACQDNGWQSIEDLGFGKGYAATDAYWRQFCTWTNSLRDQKNMRVIFTAHEHTRKVEDPELPAYDMVEIKLHKRAAAIVKEHTDVIMRACLKTTFTRDPNAKAASKKGTDDARKLAITTGQRVLKTQPRPGAVAKNRYNLPEEIPLSWDAFEAALNASKARVTTPF